MSELERRRSASESRNHGSAISTAVYSTRGRQRASRGRSCPGWNENGKITIAPRVVRKKTSAAGEMSRTAILMSRYGMPQITHSAPNRNQPRRVTLNQTSSPLREEDV